MLSDKPRPYQFGISDLLSWMTSIGIGLAFLRISDLWAAILFAGAGLVVVLMSTVRFVAHGPDTMILRILRGVVAGASVAAICYFFWIPLLQAIGHPDAPRVMDLSLIIASAGVFGGVMGIVLPLFPKALRSM